MAEMEYYQGALTGEQIDALPNRLGNRNLLDNWYFANLVNQRSQTVYTGTAQYFDRWKSTNSRATATIQSGFVRFASNSTGAAYLRQALDGVPVGTYTVSALIRGNGTGAVGLTVNSVLTGSLVFTVSDTENWTCVSKAVTLDTAPDTFSIRADADASIDILAVKLECGGTQSLAYQDNGAWILNELSNFQQELAKCQRYLYIVNSNKISYVDVAPYAHAASASVIYPLVPLPVPLRASSVNDITISDFSDVLLRPPSGTAVTPTNITPYRICGGALKLSVSASGLTAGNPYVLGYAGSASSQFIISCEL